MVTDAQTEEERTYTAAEGEEAGVDFAAQAVLVRQRGLYRDAARRFAKNKLAILGLILTLVIVFLAVFADDWFIAIPIGREAKPLLARTRYDEIFYGPVGAFPSSAGTIWFFPPAHLTKGRGIGKRIVLFLACFFTDNASSAQGKRLGG